MVKVWGKECENVLGLCWLGYLLIVISTQPPGALSTSIDLRLHLPHGQIESEEWQDGGGLIISFVYSTPNCLLQVLKT